MRKVILVSALSLVLSAAPLFAGPSNSQSSQQSSQTSQQSSQCSQQSGNCCQKPGAFSKIKDSFKKGFQAGKKVGTKAHDSIQNKVMDGGVCVKEKLTGNKDKTFVKGYYTKDGKHVKGHWRNLETKKGKR
ncbi:MAG: hypothetical protein GX031_07805 [Candidatus Riflebacteria bacterium]|jgi:hypothetical protein|nr:hypothetical protein [Candidatus Riflebacteria bacterium]NCB45641.1 hypothetical protein [bacterium]NLV94435.1 hypothetical protein [Candidatus Riflebacteria bacterium]